MILRSRLVRRCHDCGTKSGLGNDVGRASRELNPDSCLCALNDAKRTVLRSRQCWLNSTSKDKDVSARVEFFRNVDGWPSVCGCRDRLHSLDFHSEIGESAALALQKFFIRDRRRGKDLTRNRDALAIHQI